MSTEVKKMAKKLKLPHGASATQSEHGHKWRKYGGYADAVMERVLKAANDNGFARARSAQSCSPDGNTVGSAAALVHPDGWELTYGSSYGVVASSNYHHIELRRK
jgi:hypothetical protein